MAVLRIVPNVVGADPGRAHGFYGEVLGLRPAMDLGWIVTFEGPSGAQVSVASEGGQGTAVPALTVEVDDLDAVHAAVLERGQTIEYGPVDEPWGVRRFYVRDPFGTLVNVMQHGPA